MTPYQFSHISAFSVLLPLAITYWKRHMIWRKFSLLVIILILGGFNDVVSFISIKLRHTNTLNSNIYQLVEFVMIVWLFRRWPSVRRNYFHQIVMTLGIVIWTLDFFVFHSLVENSALFRVLGPILLIYVIVDQINYTLLNRDNSIIVSRMLIKGGFVLYFLYSTFVETIELFPSQIQYPYFPQLWYIQGCVSILLNVLISIAFICHREKPTYSILT